MKKRLAGLGAAAAEVVCDKGCHSNKTMACPAQCLLDLLPS